MNAQPFHAWEGYHLSPTVSKRGHRGSEPLDEISTLTWGVSLKVKLSLLVITRMSDIPLTL